MQGMKLYEINETLDALLEAAFGDDGEFVGGDEERASFEEALDQLQLAYGEKVENTALYIKNMTMAAEGIKREKQALEKRQKSLENRAARLKDYLARNLRGQKFETPRVAISWRKSTSAEITDESLIDKKYLEPQPDKIMKGEILKDLRQGLEVPGAELREGLNMQIK